jgi:geranylgeranyl diphosphate synthase, type II
VNRAGPEFGRAVDVHGYVAREASRVEAALDVLRARLSREVPEPLREPVLYALDTRGKRVRPILCAASYAAVRGREAPEAVYRIAAALEVVHTYSLVHDDLPCMDDDDLRRGRPTVHRVYGVPLATVVGAALLPVAIGILTREGAALGLGVAEQGRLTRELCGAAGARGMVGGQLLDLEAEQRSVAAEELESIHRRKTGALLAASLRVGALVAGAEEPRLTALTAYGQALGLAFQITDDVLDVTGDIAALGKSAGRDEALKKSTYPALHGLEGARALARRKAEEAVDALEAGGVRSTLLVLLARFVVERQS